MREYLLENERQLGRIHAHVSPARGHELAHAVRCLFLADENTITVHPRVREQRVGLASADALIYCPLSLQLAFQKEGGREGPD